MSERSMQVVALVGSFRSGSYARAIAETLDELAPDDVSVTLLGSVGALPHYNADLDALAFPQEATDMGAAIAGADAVVVVTPEYNFSIPGALKNALDWMSRLPLPPLKGKAIAIQSVSPGPLGGARAQYHLRQVLVSLDARVLNKPEIIIGGVAAKVDPQTELLRDEDTRRRISAQLVALTELALERSGRNFAADRAREVRRDEIRERAGQT